MGRAKETAIDGLIEVDFCQGCKVRELIDNPTYVRSSGIRTAPWETVLSILSQAGTEESVSIPVEGAHHARDITSAFNECEGTVAVHEGEIACGAIAKLRNKTNGR